MYAPVLFCRRLQDTVRDSGGAGADGAADFGSPPAVVLHFTLISTLSVLVLVIFTVAVSKNVPLNLSENDSSTSVNSVTCVEVDEPVFLPSLSVSTLPLEWVLLLVLPRLLLSPPPLLLLLLTLPPNVVVTALDIDPAVGISVEFASGDCCRLVAFRTYLCEVAADAPALLPCVLRPPLKLVPETAKLKDPSVARPFVFEFVTFDV